MLHNVGINHASAPLALREQFAIGADRIISSLSDLTHQPGVEEGIVVSTCNRTEIYAVTDYNDSRQLGEWLGSQGKSQQQPLSSLGPHLYSHQGPQTVTHALRVAAGLDSMILGEPQILGQMKQAYREAQTAHAVGPLLSRLFEHAFSVAKQVRSETGIGSHPVSVAYAAVRLAQRIFSDFSRHTAMLIGAGETIELTAHHLHERNIGRIIFANRSLDRAQRLAARYQGYAIELEAIDAHLYEADILISSTASPEPLIDRSMLQSALKRRRRKPVFAVDLAVPRDITHDTGELEDVFLYTVDDLNEVIQEGQRSREAAASEAEVLIEERTAEYMDWLQSRQANATIRGLRNRAEAERDRLLQQAVKMMNSGTSAEEAMRWLARRLTRSLLHVPSARLRKASEKDQATLMEAAHMLFPLDGDAKGRHGSAQQADTQVNTQAGKDAAE